MSRSRDKLFLLEPGFEDPNHPGQRFVCPHSNQIEGVLASFPELAGHLDIERVPFARPRRAVIAELGEVNQSLPALVLREGPVPDDAEHFGDAAFVKPTQPFSNCWPSVTAFRACMADGGRAPKRRVV